MTELTIDEKIERLVRSVLEAVDQRLDEVRAEVARVAADAVARHRQVLSMLAEHDHPGAAAPVDTAAFDERFAQIERMIDDVRAEVVARPLHTDAPAPVAIAMTPPTPPRPEPAALQPIPPAPPRPVADAPVTVAAADLPVAPVPDSLRDLSRVSAPLLPNSPSGQVPVVGTNEPIDVSRLSSLLTERLGNLQLELRAEA